MHWFMSAIIVLILHVTSCSLKHICMNLNFFFFLKHDPFWFIFFKPLLGFLIISRVLSMCRLLPLPACLSVSWSPCLCGLGRVQSVTHALLCRCGERSTTETFLGSDLARWLQSVGLASDPGEALVYGSRLLEGGVIQHITLEHGFQDEALHYRFT